MTCSKRLAHQNHISAGLHEFLYLLNALFFQVRLQLVLEIFFAQQIQAVAGDAAQHGVHHARGEFAIGGIKKRAQQGHQENQAAPAEALGKGLGVPGKEGHRPDDGQVEKAAFHPPVDSGGRTGIGMRMIQD